MSTKNLARTIIEGGRANYNKWERRHSNRKVRTKTRRYSRVVRGDPAEFEFTAPPVRDPVYKGFSDKLGPVRRWLRSQCGRPWNDVRAEMFSKFDPRTLAGQHIIYDHLLQEVAHEHEPQSRWWHPRFIVDGRGILREGPGWRRPRRRLPKGKRWRPASEVAAWSSGRKVGFRGEIGFWFIASRYTWSSHTGRREATSFRQGGRMSDADVAFWHSLVDNQQIDLEMKLD